jgi:UDP-N-acetylglucosamine 1-carboxyvinyltransferase
MIYPWFPTDLQSIFWTLLTQIKWISKIHEVLFEWRFGYFAELENMYAHIEILNPHEVLIVGWTKLKWNYVNTKDLRAWAWLILAWIVAEWETHIMNEHIIKRWYEDIVEKLKWIWVNIEEVN